MTTHHKDLLTALQDSIDQARSVLHPAPCSACDGVEAIRMEYDGSPGSGGWISCPDCQPTPPVPVDEPAEQDGQR